VRAVGPDEVAAPKRTVVRCHRYAVSVLFDAGDLDTLHDRCAGFSCRATKDWFEAGLRDEESSTGADFLNAGVQAGDDVGQLAARQRVHCDDRTLGKELVRRLRDDRLLDPRGAKQLDRAQMEMRRTR
jgi:hypothetical protein